MVFNATFNNISVVTDENDEYPEFRREEYFSSIKEKSNTFQRGALIVRYFTSFIVYAESKYRPGRIKKKKTTE
jgi:hypothetical protein